MLYMIARQQYVFGIIRFFHKIWDVLYMIALGTTINQFKGISINAYICELHGVIKSMDYASNL